MTQGISDRFWQAEARTEETKQLIRDIKRITAASLPLKRRSASFWRASGVTRPSETSTVEKVSARELTMPG